MCLKAVRTARQVDAYMLFALGPDVVSVEVGNASGERVHVGQDEAIKTKS